MIKYETSVEHILKQELLLDFEIYHIKSSDTQKSRKSNWAHKKEKNLKRFSIVISASASIADSI